MHDWINTPVCIKRISYTRGWALKSARGRQINSLSMISVSNNAKPCCLLQTNKEVNNKTLPSIGPLCAPLYKNGMRYIKEACTTKVDRC